MSKLWLFCFPLLFLPNLGFSYETPYGVLEASDWVIGPFVLLLVIAPSADHRQKISQVNLLLVGFLLWASLSTLSIHARYNYLDVVPVLVGCFAKLAKLALYVMAGVLISTKLISSRVRAQWLWSLLAAVVMLSVGLLMGINDQSTQLMDSGAGYKSYNSIIVSMAILGSYIAGLWIDNVASRRWRSAAMLVVGFAICSVLLSASLTAHGRGGWLALIVGCGYIFWKKTRRTRAFAIVLFLSLTASAAYEALPNFKSLVDTTISSRDDAETYRVSGVDEGARVTAWMHEAPNLINAPLLGTGFYHRGGPSGLWDTGSHNFFIQMFLETGVVGGVLVLMVFVLMWRQAGSAISRQARISIATRAALITAVVGGMSGEYYYGNVSVLVLFAVFAFAGAGRLETVTRSAGNQGLQIRSWQRVAS
ncbi:MAG TPA: O-antigen ligase family protein [Terriglobales bacterium]|nr:O-antigen ligase family protein [Terriglobales bacterium]